MNKGRQLIVALLVLGVAVGTALLVWRDPFEKSSRPNYSSLLLARAEGSIDKIMVVNKEGSLTAEKRGDTWWLIEPREAPADDGQLKAAAAALEKMTVVDEVSKKPERQPEYGLAKDSAERLEIKAFAAGAEVLNFAAGKRVPDGQGVFIVLAKDPNTVFATSGSLPPVLNKGIRDWRSKVVVDIPGDKIERLQVVNSKGALDLEKASGDLWQKKDDPNWQADNARFGQVVASFTRLPWTDVVDEPEAAVDYGFKTPQARVTVTAAGKDQVLVFGKDVEGSTGKCWLQIEGDPKVYQVTKGILDRFTRDFDYYRGEAAKPDQEAPKQ